MSMLQAMELQEQLNAFNRDLRSVRNALGSAQREARMNAVTTNQIQVIWHRSPHSFRCLIELTLLVRQNFCCASLCDS
jgi:hypothetical protein